MVFTPEQDAFILMAHFRSGNRNADGTWSYSLQSCIDQFAEAFPDASMTYDTFSNHRSILLKRFENKHCICKGKPTGRPTVVTEEVIEDVRSRMKRNPNKPLSKLAAETGLSVGTCHKVLKAHIKESQPQIDDDDEDEGGTSETSDNTRYTHEQKIVAAVWVHEKEFNEQKWKDIHSNFVVRFHADPPNRRTFLNWEKKLFTAGSIEDKEKRGRPLSRLMHVPYVKASLKEAPDLSLRERSKILGLPRTTLLNIIRDDLNMEFEVEQDGNSNVNRKHAPQSGGKWKEKTYDVECKLEVESDEYV